MLIEVEGGSLYWMKELAGRMDSCGLSKMV